MMNVFALAADNAAELTFADRLSTAGIVSLQGMLTIFLVLSILWGAVELMHYALVGRKEKKKATAAVEEPAPVVESAPAVESAPVVESAPAVESAPVAVADDGAIVAAITAAIAAQLASDGYTGGFRVVSFKRSGANSKKRA